MTTRGLPPWIALGLVAAGMSGCVVKETFDNPVHCANNNGDAFCAESYPDGSRPHCASGLGDCAQRYVSGKQRYCHTNGACADVYDGCMAMQPEEECWAQWGRGQPPETGTSEDGGSSSAVGSSGMGQSSSTSVGSETGSEPCLGHEDCVTADAPLCVDGDCVPCDVGPAEGCEAKDSATPVCDAGECVQCTGENTAACEDATPVCDAELRQCEPCSEHQQCPGSACNLVEGSCLPLDAVIHVDGDGGREFTSIGAALASVSAGVTAVLVVHERNADTPYVEAVTIDGGRTIALLAADGETPVLQGPGASSAVAVNDASTSAFLERIQLRNSGGYGVSCDAAFVDLRRAWVVQNDGGALLATNACQLHVANAFTGGDVNNVDAIVVEGSTAELLYGTVVAGDGNLGGSSRALTCDPASTVTVRNSLLVAIDDATLEVDCAGANVSHSASENAMLGDGNVALGDIQGGWLVDLADDFHLDSPPATLATTALWQDGDPMLDIDGDTRPAIVGGAEHAGADFP